VGTGKWVIVLAAAVLLCAPAAALADHNDLFVDRVFLNAGSGPSISSNAAATTAGENFLVPGTASTCPNGAQMVQTMWWSVNAGHSGRVTVTTDGSDFDTVLGLYQGAGGQPAGFPICNDDMHGDSVRSRLRLNVSPGFEYPIQVGGCTGITGCGATSGQIVVSVHATPGNDDRAEAVAVAPGGSSGRIGTGGATTEAGEQRACGGAPFEKTVWYSFTPPSTGTATFNATGFDTVISVYEGGAAQPVRCLDDPQTGDQATLSMPVRPITYLIQVGGYGADDADSGPLTLNTGFSDPDVDDDGASGGDDCDDRDPARSRLKPEVVNNTVDENCDGIPAFNRDGDGHLAPPAGRDCDDGNGAIHPGARDVRGNARDEDCVGGPAPYLRMGTTIRARYFADFPRTRFERLIVQNAEAGSRIVLLCKGRRCPFARRAQKVRRATRVVELHRHFKHGRVPAGLVLTVRVTKPGTIGIGRRFKTRARRLPVDDDLCHNPARNRWRTC
jgi:hypothetical protein